jgi:hypothetical protein
MWRKSTRRWKDRSVNRVYVVRNSINHPSFNYAHCSSLEAPISFDKICGISCHTNHIALSTEVSKSSPESVIVETLQPKLYM